jgi:hypothetical protein
MKRVLPQLHLEMKFNHVPYFQRFFMFVKRTRVRFTGVALLFITFTVWGNFLILASSKIERTFRKYKKRWIFNKYPALMAYQSAIDTAYEPKNLSK